MKHWCLFTYVVLYSLLSVQNAQADILIGVAGPLTGPNAAFGAQLQKGAEQAAADINAAGGINGEQIKIVLGDDVSDPKQGFSVANKFVADGVKFVIGHFNSGVSIPASEVYAENGILQITPSSTNPTFTERGLWNTFRTCGRDDQQAAVAGAFIAANFRGANVAIVHDGTPYGSRLSELTKSALNEGRIGEVIYQGISGGTRDFSSLVAKMKEADVSLVYYGGLHTEAGLIMREIADQGLKATLMSGDGIVSKELASIAGDAVNGTLMTFPPDPRKNPAARELVEKFRAAGFEPEDYTLYSYSALQVIAEAAKKTGGNDPQVVAQSLKENGPFKTVIGELSFDYKGDNDRQDYVMYRWTKGNDGRYSYFELEGYNFSSTPDTCAISACAAGYCCRNNMCTIC